MKKLPDLMTPQASLLNIDLQPKGEPKVNDVFGEVISSYSRAQAIEDGVLVDLMQGELASLVREAGFKFPIAMTTAAFELAVWPIAEEDGSYDTLRGAANKWLESKCQGTNGRLWEVLWIL